MKRIYRKFEAPADILQCLPIEQSMIKLNGKS